MSKAHPPELKKYMDKKMTRLIVISPPPTVLFARLPHLGGNYHLGEGEITSPSLVEWGDGVTSVTSWVKLNGGRQVTGILRGFDPFMNMVVDESIEECKDGSKVPIGMVVIRGNSIVMLESLERI
ncbi:hypothetical protein AAG570_007098 [Ranatra chinensis]|uniref:Small nuclear ribonucleoprotein G n=1 Tax=Ranatra chinensis TaxID=642074 RepID=A0ABD0XUV4_9HEMI